MKPRINFRKILAVAFTCISVSALSVACLYAHCDTLSGPVTKDAKRALNKADVTPALKWVAKEREPEVKAAFDKALAQRTQGKEAKERADMEFFETLVRIHREGEGEAFTGLKPSGTPVDPLLITAEKALEHGSADKLVNLIANNVASGIRRRFTDTIEKRKHANESVEAGREFVKAYVEFMHYVEHLYLEATAKVANHIATRQSEGTAHH